MAVDSKPENQTDRAAEPGRPRKERSGNAAMRRRQLVDATMRSIVEHGLARTTLATVSARAGLSQGVVAFYFQNKETLLAAALRHQYEAYQAAWQAALERAGPDPADRLAALIRADFEPEACNPESLIIWHAFWGEASARPLYSEISDRFDTERAHAMRDVCAELLAQSGRPVAEADAIGTGIDALTDGLWLRLYLSGDELTAAEAMALALRLAAAAFPAQAARIAADLPDIAERSPGARRP